MTERHTGPKRSVRVVPPAELRAELEARATARPRTRQRRRLARGRLSLVLASLATGLLVAGVFADSGSLNVEVANRQGYAAAKTTDGAIVEYIGDQNTSFGAAGTGVFDSFVRIQKDGSEQGYNTNGTLEFDTKSGTWTHAIKVSEIPVVPCASADNSQTTAGFCWELFSDINENNNTPLISLNDVEIYFTANANITGYPFAGPAPNTATKVYDFSGEIKINDVNQGSGRGDLRYLVPISGISIPANCNFGNSACATYFVLYTRWGTSSGYTTDGGFEEWKVKQYPFLSVTKTATTSFTRTFAWEIAKSVTPDSWDLFTGDTGTSEYTVTVTKTGFTDSDWAVSGTITITNPSTQDAVIASVTDEISGVGTPVTPTCGVTFPHTLKAGNTLTCSYSSPLPDGSNRTNTATATLTTGPVFTGSAAVTFGDPTTVVNGTVHVSDTNGGSWTFSDTGSQTYTETFSCDRDQGTHNNTATISETNQSASASVTVACHALEVSKTAETSFTRTFNWEIAKSVTPATWNLFTGDTGTSEYTVTVTKTGFTDSDWAVSGQIFVHNPAPIAATLKGVSDVVSGVDAATVDCGSGVTFPYTLAAGDTLTCSYSLALPNANGRTNTATATLQNHDYASDGTSTASGTTDFSGSAAVTFGDPTTVVNGTVHVSDTNGGSWTFSDTGSQTYTETFSCDGDQGTHNNTATISETNQSASASVTVACHALEVSKTAETSFTRTYHWTIVKSSDDPNGQFLTLNPGEVYVDYPYEVTVDATFTDSDWAVSGQIFVHNPAPIAATLNGVSDVVSGVDAATVDCGSGVTFPYTLAAGDTLTCSYSLALPNANDQANTATATLQNHDYASDGTSTASGTTDFSGSTAVFFASATVTEVDETITVTDTFAGLLGTVTYGVDTLPKTFTYPRTFGPFGTDACGEHNFPNTATFTTNDTETTGSSSWNVQVTVPCPEGCTLTQGYWKTHSAFGPARPADPTWDLLPSGADTTFFLSGKTWYEVFWTSPKGGNAYYILAHQYMAAKLNILAGAASTPSVDAAIAWAESFFNTYTPTSHLTKSLRQQAIATAGVLAQYNEGLIGPGHCSEDGIARAAGG